MDGVAPAPSISRLGDRLERSRVGRTGAGGDGPAESGDRLLADPPSGDVDHPLERDRVRVAAQDPQIGQGVLDLAPLVEPRPADQLVADAVAQEGFLDGSALGIRPVHHGDVARVQPLVIVIRPTGQDRARPTGQLLHLAGDPFGLLLLVVGLEALDRPAAGVLGPQLLVLARRIPADDGMGSVEDELRRAVVLLELDDRRVRFVALEVEDVPKVGAAPRVDRLVVVADHRQVVVAGSERANPQVLRPVRVLVFVDVEVAPAVLVAGEDVGRVLEQPDRLEQEVVEVERPDGPQARLVGPGETGDDPLVVVEGDLVEGVGVEHLVLRPADRAEHGRRPELAGRREVLLAQELLHQRLLVVRVVDDETPVDPDRAAVAPEDPGADGVERPGLDVAAGLPDKRHDPFTELTGRTVGEGDGQDLPGPDALHPDEVGDAVGKDPGLAAPGTGQDQQRALGRRDRPGLLRVEPGDDPLGQGRGRRGGGSLVDRRLRRRLGVVEGWWAVGQEVGFDGRPGRRPGGLDPDDLVAHRVRRQVVGGRLGTTASAPGAHGSILKCRPHRPVTMKPAPRWDGLRHAGANSTTG